MIFFNSATDVDITSKESAANVTDIPMVLDLLFCFTSAIIHKTESTTKTIKQIKQVTADIGKKT